MTSSSPGSQARVHGVAVEPTSRRTGRQTKRRPALRSSAPGSSPASQSTWKPLQMPSTGPPAAAKRRSASTAGGWSSPCQRASASPPRCSTAARASRTSHDPGKVTTPNRTLPPPPPFGGPPGHDERVRRPCWPAAASQPREAIRGMSQPTPPGSNRVRPGWPGGHGPALVVEGAVAEADGRHGDLGVDPEEAAARSEVAERGLGAALAHPVRPLAVVQLEAEAPVERVEAADPWEQAADPGELHAGRLGELLGGD